MLLNKSTNLTATHEHPVDVHNVTFQNQQPESPKEALKCLLQQHDEESLVYRQVRDLDFAVNPAESEGISAAKKQAHVFLFTLW